MRVSDSIRKCVVFVGYRMATGEFRRAGTAFYYARPIADSGSSSVFLVTARHVIDGIRALGLNESCLRINFTDGSAQWLAIPIEAWFIHPTEQNVDVAAAPFPLADQFDHMLLPSSVFATPEVQKSFGGIGLATKALLPVYFAIITVKAEMFQSFVSAILPLWTRSQ